MTITVLLFAGVKEIVGSSSVDLQLDVGANVADIQSEMGKKFDGLSALMTKCAFAIDDKYVDPETALVDGTTVACIPPVSGG